MEIAVFIKGAMELHLEGLKEEGEMIPGLHSSSEVIEINAA